MTPIRDDRVSDEAAGELAAVSVIKNGLKPPRMSVEQSLSRSAVAKFRQEFGGLGLIREMIEGARQGAEANVETFHGAEPDRLALACIGRERDPAIARYRRDRDTRALEASMQALDGQEADAKAGEAAQVLEPAEVVAFLRDLPTPWDAAPGGRRALAESLFRPGGGVGAPADAP